MALQIYNVLTQKKESCDPVIPGLVRMYVCGPTVYDHAHVGHAKTYIAFDVLVRYLRFQGYRVRYVQNITDVGHLLDTGEDRVLTGAARERMEPMELVERYTRSYLEDMDALGVIRPDISPRASGHIPEQIDVITTLIEKGHAYVAEGSVYFDVSSFPRYGMLSGRRLDELNQGTREPVREEKRHPADFALWKKAPPGHILRWRSPWGWGYPGWHIECSAMAIKYLGENFDIHGGGLDNIFPHNECEIAQAEAATGTPFAHLWVLTGSLTVGGVKMSKSLGNFITIKEILTKHRPEALRLSVLSGHYRHPLDFGRDSLDAAARGLERLWTSVRAVRKRLGAAEARGGTPGGEVSTLLESSRQRFFAAMDDDLNTPAALAVLFDLVRDVNKSLEADRLRDRDTLQAIDETYRQLGGQILGIVPETFTDAGQHDRVDPLLRLVLDLRERARVRQDFTEADVIRDRLQELGIEITDTPGGPDWRFRDPGE